MSDMNTMLASVLTDTVARSFLEQVAQSRWLRFGELKKSPSVSRETAQATVRKLQDLQLIDVKPSGIEDFNAVYITAAGLEATRKIGS